MSGSIDIGLKAGVTAALTASCLLAPAAASPGDVCTGNYVPPGQRGHGAIDYANGAAIGWTVVDFADETGCVKVVCRHGVAPQKGVEDVDFFEVGGVIYKLISGDVTVSKDAFAVTPKRAVRMKVFSTASAFPADKTPLLYSLNHWREDNTHHRKTMPPLDYLRYLKETNETCADLPVTE